MVKIRTTFLSVLKIIGGFGQRLVATRSGKPAVETVLPPEPQADKWLGAMRDEGTILGDLVEPVAGPDDWEAACSHTRMKKSSSLQR